VSLERLAELLRERNRISSEIASLIGRPALSSHLGEYIASKIFDIELYESATHKGADGQFRSGPLKGKTVNVKLYGKKEGFLDINHTPADYYLVLTGSNSPPVSSRGGDRPLLIQQAFIFNMGMLLTELRGSGVKIGIATSITKSSWEAAMIYPRQRNTEYTMSNEQSKLIELFQEEVNRF
jgi:hypothetical protein